MASRNGSGDSPGLPRRRNGKQQACEPCRKAKIACDHTTPVCDRCKRRKVASKCVYLDAPMTRKGSPPAVSTARPYSNGVSRRNSHHAPATHALPTPSISASASCASPIASPVQTHESSTTPGGKAARTPTISSSGPFIKSGGFFGPTNFSAVFSENRENLGSSSEFPISNDFDSSEPLPSSESLQSQTFLMLAGSSQESGENCSPRVALGAKVLRALPDRQTCEFLMEYYSERCNECVFHKFAILGCVSSIWEVFSSHLKEPRRAKELHHVSGILCKNAKIPLQEPDDYPEWLESFCGVNMRWETLGIVFAALAQSMLSLPEKDAFFKAQRGARKDRKSFAVEMKDCVQACVTLSNYMDLINFPMVVLLCKNMILQTVISGDASLVVWRQLGDLVSSSTALGLHRQIDNGQPVTFLTEMRRRCFAVVFSIDKSNALLTGRPPFMSYQYTCVTAPLDLSDEVIMHGGDVLLEAIGKLDKDGFNTEGQVYQATMTKARWLLAIALDEILQLSLGDPKDCTEERIKYLLDRLRTTYSSFPMYLHFSLSSPITRTLSDYHFWKTLCLRLHYLEHRLLLERLAYKHGILSGKSLIDCASEMLSLTVLIWVQRDRFIEHHQDFDWMLMCWGVPSSGVLCVELLKQLRSKDGKNQVLRIPRSEIVQNLSLLIGFLEWVRPAAGNYLLCGRMRCIIRRILDQILDPSPPSSQPSLPASSAPNSSAEQESRVGSGEEMDGVTDTHPPFDMSGNGNVNNCSNGVANTNGIMGQFDTAIPPPSAFDMGNYGDGLGLDNLEWLDSVDWSRGPWIDLGVGGIGTGTEFSAAAQRWNMGF